MSSTSAPPSTKKHKIDMEDLNEATIAYINEILSEKETLSKQNSQLWKIIQKQRLIIQQLQKTLVKKDAFPSLKSEAEDLELNSSYKDLSGPPSLKSDSGSSKTKSKIPSLVRNVEASFVPLESNSNSNSNSNQKMLKTTRLRSQSVNKDHLKDKESSIKHSRSKTVISSQRQASVITKKVDLSKENNRLFSRQIDNFELPTVKDQISNSEKQNDSLFSLQEEEEINNNTAMLHDNEDNEDNLMNIMSSPEGPAKFKEKSLPQLKKANRESKRYTIKDHLLELYMSSDMPNESPSTATEDNTIENHSNEFDSVYPKTPMKKASIGTIQSLPETSNKLSSQGTLIKKSSLQFDEIKTNLPDKINNKVQNLEKIPNYAREDHINNIKSTPDELLELRPHDTQSDNQSLLVSNLKSLDGIVVKVVSSSVTINSKGKEVLIFRIHINKINSSENQFQSDSKPSKSDFVHLWTIDKLFSDFLDLDSKLKTSNKYTKVKGAKLPEKKSLNTVSPSKIDQRKLALQSYLQNIIDSNKLIPSFVSDFITKDIVNTSDNDKINGIKDGYLIKRGKNFGKWKRRYFLIKDGALEYFESKNGQRLGIITLMNAQVAVQHTSSSEYEPDSTTSDAFRHAFMILEPKKGSTTVNRHVLCADSDRERDDWVEAISFYLKREVDSPESIEATSNNGPLVFATGEVTKKIPEPISLENINEPFPNASLSPTAISMSSSETHQNSLPYSLNSPEQKDTNTGSTQSLIKGPIDIQLANDPQVPTKSRDRAASKTKTEALAPIGTLKNSKKDEKDSGSSKEKSFKQFFWNKKIFSSENSKPKPIQSPVFGVPLAQSVLASKVSKDYELPSVVYRCIQYLDAKLAQNEEGIYRLSGSSATIRALKTKFDTEGDYPILESGVYYDVHAIAGLLKLYLRELPSTVLTAELHRDFLQITDLLSRKERVHELGRLICSLPIENYTLLRALIGHLITIIQESEINKMNLRNIAIVFAPTLGIPAGVFSLLIAEFKYVFFVNSSGAAAPQDISDEEIIEIQSDSVTSNPSNSASASKNSSITDLSTVPNNPENTSTEVAPINAVRFTEDTNYETKSSRRARHRRTMSAGANAIMAQALSEICATNDLTKLDTNLPIESTSVHSRPKSAYSDMSYLAPSLSLPKAPLQSLKELKKEPKAEVEDSESRISPKQESPTLPEPDNYELASPAIKALRKRRSNRNSLIYKYSAPPELVRLEEKIGDSPQVDDELIEDEAFSTEIGVQLNQEI